MANFVSGDQEYPQNSVTLLCSASYSAYLKLKLGISLLNLVSQFLCLACFWLPWKCHKSNLFLVIALPSEACPISLMTLYVRSILHAQTEIKHRMTTDTYLFIYLLAIVPLRLGVILRTMNFFFNLLILYSETLNKNVKRSDVCC